LRWDSIESGLTPRTAAPSFSNCGLISENSRASAVQPLVLSLG
jgi:hypothetical protein